MINPAAQPRIRLLPEALANQIAAGEVIERPAAVVKELLENSIDAGADDIHIEIEGGGVGLIRVRDNGCGIHKDDLELALLSHATSKIHEPADLHRITSLGFRGEALSSIAAVAQFQLTSRMQSVEQAWRIWKDPFSTANELQPAAHPVGTTVEVKNLFYATPARRKFLKSGKTEFLHILEMVRRIALSRFDVNIRLLHDDRQVLVCRSDPHQPDILIRTIMGTEFTQGARRLDYSAGTMRLWGWSGTAAMSRSQMDRQYFYFNGRMIRDKHINHAIRMVYVDSLPAGRFPVYVLYLEDDPAAADVNVHPTKFEIRFQRARDVHDFIYSSLKSALEQDASRFPGTGEFGGHGVVQGRSGDARTASAGNAVHETRSDYRLSATTAPPGAESTALGQPRLLLYDRFIISQRGSEYLLVDIERARRQLVKIKMLMVTDAIPAPARPLLVPVSMSVSSGEAELAEKYGQRLARYGLTLERQAPQAIVIRTVPASLPEVDLQPLVRELLDLLRSTLAETPAHERVVEVFSAHAGNGATGTPGMADMQQLLRALAMTDVVTNTQGIWRVLDRTTLAKLVAPA